MRTGTDISRRFTDLYVVHHNLPGKKTGQVRPDDHLLFVPLQGEIGLQLEHERLAIGPGRDSARSLPRRFRLISSSRSWFSISS